MNRTFIQLLKRKRVSWEEIHNFIDEWHKSDSELPLYEFLGMTLEQYVLWVTNPRAAEIVADLLE